MVGKGSAARNLGYRWENDLVKRYRNDPEDPWEAVRLGAPSLHLPDIMATRKAYKHMAAQAIYDFADAHNQVNLYTGAVIECKAGTGRQLTVKRDQIMRLFDWSRRFMGPYIQVDHLLAFRFTGGGKTREWFIKCYGTNGLDSVHCRRDGLVWTSGGWKGSHPPVGFATMPWNWDAETGRIRTDTGKFIDDG